MVTAKRFHISPSRVWSAPLGKMIPAFSADRLRDAIKRLRVWEALREDLSYPQGDPRREIPEHEMSRDWHTERDTIRESIVFHAAMLSGETEADADAYADAPLSTSSPYNLDRVLLAAAIMGEGLALPDHPAPDSPWPCGHNDPALISQSGQRFNYRGVQRCAVCGVSRFVQPWKQGR